MRTAHMAGARSSPTGPRAARSIAAASWPRISRICSSATRSKRRETCSQISTRVPVSGPRNVVSKSHLRSASPGSRPRHGTSSRGARGFRCTVTSTATPSERCPSREQDPRRCGPRAHRQGPELGFGAAKVKVGFAAEVEPARIARLREGAAAGIALMTDANQAWDEATALTVLRAAEGMELA